MLGLFSTIRLTILYNFLKFTKMLVVSYFYQSNHIVVILWTLTITDSYHFLYCINYYCICDLYFCSLFHSISYPPLQLVSPCSNGNSPARFFFFSLYVDQPVNMFFDCPVRLLFTTRSYQTLRIFRRQRFQFVFINLWFHNI